jgi:serine/threonine-protein phosphatase 4 regulatory subunit 1
MEQENAQGDGEEFIFNEYAIDDTLDPLDRLVRYHTSDFSLQRLVLIRELSDTAEFAGFQKTQRELLPLLRTFVQDSEPTVRHVFAQQLAPLAKYMVADGGEEGYQDFLSTLLPFGVELLVDKNVEVGAAALQTMKDIAELMRDEHVDPHLLAILQTLAHDERAEDYRMVAAQLFDELAPKLGKAHLESTVLGEMRQLANDASFSVRRTVAFSLSSIAKELGPELADAEVLPLYTALSKDEVWGVRKSCAESIVGISSALDDSKRGQLIPIFKSLSEDSTRWVRVAAYQQLGHFIHTMPRDSVNSMFLKMFTDMAFQSEGGDSDFSEYCAFSFPAVAQVMGKDRWRELDDAYATLLKDVQWKVRKTLAFSLHELAKIVGTEITEKSLTQALDLFLKDIDEVKLGVISNIDEFLAVVSEGARDRYVSAICAVPVDSENWRLRHAVAAKLGHVVQLVSPRVIGDQVVDLVLRLLEDSVMDVRSCTYFSAAMVLIQLESTADSRSAYDQFLQHIVALASKPTFQSRQMFLYVLQQVLEAEDKGAAVAEQLLPHLATVAGDRVSNVRYVAARVIANSAANNARWQNHPKIVEAKHALAQDTEADVAQLAVAQLPRLENAAFAAQYRQEPL